MPMSSSRWEAVSRSDLRWELEALDWLRRHLPDHDPWRVWSHFSFIADDGTINEVDALVLSPAGLFLVAVDSGAGVVEGDQHLWNWISPGHSRYEDNPLVLARRKARRLTALIGRQPSLAKRRGTVSVEALVFLSAPNLDCRLSLAARHRVYRPGRPGEPDDDGVIAAVSTLPPRKVDDERPVRIDPAMGRALAQAVEQAGLRPARVRRRVGDYELGGLLQDGGIHQDWEATQVNNPAERRPERRRIRVYPYPSNMEPDQRAAHHRSVSQHFGQLQSFSHDGILRVSEFLDSEHGPALAFEHTPDLLRLDLFLAERLSALSVDARLNLLRQLAETLHYAHDRNIHHRGLTPRSILVRDPDSRHPRLHIFNWQPSVRKAASSRGRTGSTLTAASLENQPDLVYLAPELLHEPDRRGPHLDIWSLGAVAYHLFSGRPPANSIVDLSGKLAGGRGLRLSDVIDGAPVSLQELIAACTNPRVTARLASMDRVLDLLNDVEKELAVPEPDRVVNPTLARPGDRLDGGFTVKDRLGKGSTAVALLVRRDGDEDDRVLKVALDPSLNDRLRREASALDRLRHPNVVALSDSSLTIGGHAALLIARAGDETLREVLDRHGRLSIDVLERYGEDLLTALVWLEQNGINHRDIKPANIGVALLGRKGRKGLVLFDFSLSAAPPEDITAGTRPYLDPFLRRRPRPQWDPQAEHFAAAMTLFEMATGTLPVWGDGESDPALIDVEATVDASLFDAAVRDDLAVFFRKALASNAVRRFDNAEAMLRAWRQAFEAVRRTVLTPKSPDEAFEALLRRVGPQTTIAELGLSDGALSVLDGMGIHCVRELLAVDRRVFRYLRNVSDRVRKEIRETAKALATRRPDLRLDRTSPVDDPEGGDETNSIDALFERLLPRRGFAEASSDADPVDLLLGCDAIFEGGLDGGDARWRTPGDAAALAGKARATMGMALEEARKRWQRLKPYNDLRDSIADIVAANGGVMAGDELARALVADRGCVEPAPKRWSMAAAVARAAIETEAAQPVPRFRLFLGDGGDSGDGGDGPPLIATDPLLARYARALGEVADRIAAGEAVPTPTAALERLRAVPTAHGLDPVPDWRLAHLATAVSRGAALSSRSEIYPVGMPAARALALAAGTLAGAKALSIDRIRDRVENRYPRAEPLPGRPALDDLLTATGLDVVWEPQTDEGRGAYVPRAMAKGAGSSVGRTPRRRSTAGSTGGAVGADGSPEMESARSFEERLTRSLSAGAFLALVAPYRRAAMVEQELIHERFGVERVSVDGLLIDAMQAEAEAQGASWETVAAADAAEPSSLDWRLLGMLVRRCAPAVERRLMAADRPLLLTDAGLIGRYNLIDTLVRLRDAAGRPGGPPALWLLCPADGLLGAPVLEGRPVPVLGATQWARVPDVWITNGHRAGHGAHHRAHAT